MYVFTVIANVTAHMFGYIFLDLTDCNKYWSQVVSTHTDYLALNQLALSQNWC